MTLEFVDDEQVAQLAHHISTLLYGPKGIGKTAAAASAPTPIIYANADAPQRLRFARRLHGHTNETLREVRVRPRTTVTDPPTARKTLTELYLYVREGNGVETVVLDPLGRIYELVADDIGGQRPSLNDFYDAQKWMLRYVESFLELPVNLVLVAHDLGYQVSTTEGGDQVYELFPFCGSKSNPGLAKDLMRPLDIVAYCGVVTKETATDRFPEGSRIAQLFHGGGRQGADGTGVLGEAAILDLSAWVAATKAAAVNSKTKEKK